MSNYFENTEAVDAWFKRRRSRFTSSENSKLLVNSKQGPNSKWSTSADTYIDTKVLELTTAMYERPQLDEVEALRHGKANEFPSFERYVKETGNHSFTYMGDENPIFIPCKVIRDESGGTPDCSNIISAEGEDVRIDFGCELKNPVNPMYHFRRLKWKTQWDLKEGNINYYTQIQDLIRLTGASGWDFVSHDERQLVKSKQIKIIPVKPDRKFIDNLEARIMMAVEEKYKIISRYFEMNITNRADFERLVKN